MNREIYAATVARYNQILHIDCYAVPASIGNEIHACLFHAPRLVEIVASDSKLIEYGKNELFPRWGRILTPTKLFPAIRPFEKIPMGIETINNVKAQEWEMLILNVIGGIYKGMEVDNVDIIHAEFGRIEIKKGRGKIGEYA